MKKMLRIISLMLILTFSVLLFYGCNDDEMAVFNAFMKQNEITSAQTSTLINLSVSSEGLDPQIEQEMAEFFDILQSLSITIDTKTIQNETKDVVKSWVKISTELQDTPMDTEFWMDVDLQSENLKAKYIIKPPEIADSYLPEDFINKEYIVMDTDSMSDEALTAELSEPLSAQTEMSSEMQELLIDFATQYATDFDPGFTFIERTEDRIINGENHKVYLLHLDDAMFKELIKQSLLQLLQSDKIIPLMDDLNGILDMNTGTEDVSVEQMTAEYEEAIPQLLESIEMFFDTISDLQIVGDNGIVIEYVINNEGYIVCQSGNMEFVIDLDAIKDLLTTTPAVTPGDVNILDSNSEVPVEAPNATPTVLPTLTPDPNVYNDPSVSPVIDPYSIPSETPNVDTYGAPSDIGNDSLDTMTGKIFINANFSTGIFNINQITDIYFPNVNEQNSVDIFQSLLAQTTGAIPKAPRPVNPGDTMYIQLKINEPSMVANGYAEEIDPGRGTTPIIKNSRTILPIRAVVEAIGGEISWEGETKKVTIYVDGTEIEMWIDKYFMYVNKLEKHNDVAPQIINARTYVPLRFVAENVGCTVDWDGKLKVVHINYIKN